MIVSSSGNDGQTGNALLPSGRTDVKIDSTLRVLYHQHMSKKIGASLGTQLISP